MRFPMGSYTERRQWRLEAVRLQEIESNPFTPEDNALFDMFDRNGWSDSQRRGYLTREALRRDRAAQKME